jgi:hypothetical protein
LVEIESSIERLILSKIDAMENSVERIFLFIIHANGNVYLLISYFYPKMMQWKILLFKVIS